MSAGAVITCDRCGDELDTDDIVLADLVLCGWCWRRREREHGRLCQACLEAVTA